MTEKEHTPEELKAMQKRIEERIKNRKKDIIIEDPGDAKVCDGCA